MDRSAFQEANVGGITVKNRIFRSATHEGTAGKGGAVSEAIVDMYRELSEGEVGLIITGFMSFSRLDNPSTRTVLLDDDSKIPELRKMTDMVHARGTKIVTQMAHVGSQLTHPPTGTVYAASDVVDPINGIKPTPFTAEQIGGFVREFGEAALRAKRAGFDGVQIHGAHGYLISKFLSPAFNRRTDAYGGSPENRARIVVEILREIKDRCGADYPVWIKLNCSDFGRNDEGLIFEDALVIAEKIAGEGIDAIELSGGTMTGAHSPARSRQHEAYHLDYAKKVTEAVDVPVILVGGIRNPDTIETILEETRIEAVSLCRPLIREPGLVKRWMEGDRKDAACVACNGCFNPKGAVCFFTLEGEERESQKEFMKMMASMGKES